MSRELITPLIDREWELIGDAISAGVNIPRIFTTGSHLDKHNPEIEMALWNQYNIDGSNLVKGVIKSGITGQVTANLIETPSPPKEGVKASAIGTTAFNMQVEAEGLRDRDGMFIYNRELWLGLIVTDKMGRNFTREEAKSDVTMTRARKTIAGITPGYLAGFIALEADLRLGLATLAAVTGSAILGVNRSIPDRLIRAQLTKCHIVSAEELAHSLPLIRPIDELGV